MENQEKSMSKEQLYELLVTCLYTVVLIGVVIVGITSGNVGGGLMTFIASCFIFSVAGRGFHVPDKILCPVCTLVCIGGSFIFYGGKMNPPAFEKNGVRKTVPFIAIPFYDRIIPVQDRMKLSAAVHRKAISMTPIDRLPEFWTLKADMVAYSKSGMPVPMDSSKLTEGVENGLRELDWVIRNTSYENQKKACQTLKEFLEKEFPEMRFSGTLSIQYATSAVAEF